MYQYDDPTTVATIPASTTPGTPGFFTDGNPGTGLPATILHAEFMNMLMMEISNAVTGSGLTLSKSANNQLATAIATSVSAATVYGGVSLATSLLNYIGRVVNSISALRAISHTSYTVAFATGYYANGDGGGGQYYYDPTDTTTADNGGSVIVASDGARWKLICQGIPTVEMFGAKHDGSTDDYPAFTAMIAAYGHGMCNSPEATYKLNSPLVLTTSNYLNLNGATLDFTGCTFGIASYCLPAQGGGAGYTGGVTFTMPTPGGGVAATATATVVGGVVTNVVSNTAGSGYLTQPTPTITGISGGSGAYVYPILQACVTISIGSQTHPVQLANGRIMSSTATVGGTCISMSDPYARVENMTLYNGCAGYWFGSQAYCDTVSGGKVTGCWLAVCSDLSNASNAGERIDFQGVTFGNNQYILFNNRGEIELNSCSQDYPNSGGSWILDNINYLGGVPSGRLTINGGHMETTTAHTGDTIPRITNNGLMCINSATVYDDGTTTSYWFARNYGQMYLNGLELRRGDKGQYIIDNHQYVSSVNAVEGHYSGPQRLCAATSGMYNNGFELNNFIGWTNAGPAYATIGTASPPVGSTYYAVLTSSASNPCAITSPPIPVQMGASHFIASIIRQNNNAVTLTWDIKFWSAGASPVQLGTTITLTTNAIDGAWATWVEKGGCPVGAAYATFTLTLAANVANPTAFVDEFYVTFH